MSTRAASSYSFQASAFFAICSASASEKMGNKKKERKISPQPTATTTTWIIVTTTNYWQGKQRQALFADQLKGLIKHIISFLNYHYIIAWIYEQQHKKNKDNCKKSNNKVLEKTHLSLDFIGIIAIITKLQSNQLKRSYLRLDLNGIGLSLSPEGLHLSFSFSLKHFLWMLWSSGWQKLAAIRRRQKWPWKFLSSTYLKFSRQIRRFCA